MYISKRHKTIVSWLVFTILIVSLICFTVWPRSTQLTDDDIIITETLMKSGQTNAAREFVESLPLDDETLTNAKKIVTDVETAQCHLAVQPLIASGKEKAARRILQLSACHVADIDKTIEALRIAVASYAL